MIVPRAIGEQYARTEALLDETARRVRDTVLAFCEAHGFMFEGRKKSLQSVAEKVESGRYDSWLDLDDLYACTVVVPLVSHEPGVLEFLNQAFERRKLTKRGEVKKAPDVFRFDATRFVGRIRKPEGIGLGGALSIYDMQFEVQVRTVFEHAWIRTTHALAYKAQHVEWARQRLAAQLKASVEQLDMLALGFEGAVEFVGEGKSPDIEDKASVERFFGQMVQAAVLPSEVRPKDWARFCDNVYRLLQSMQGERPTGRSDKKLTNLSPALRTLRSHMESLGSDRFPRSISLLQYVTGVLLESGEFRIAQSEYRILVTRELAQLFPCTAELGGQFQFTASPND